MCVTTQVPQKLASETYRAHRQLQGFTPLSSGVVAPNLGGGLGFAEGVQGRLSGLVGRNEGGSKCGVVPVAPLIRGQTGLFTRRQVKVL